MEDFYQPLEFNKPGEIMNNQKDDLVSITDTNNYILEQRARDLAKLPGKDSKDEDVFHLVTFPVGNELYGVEIAFVQEAQPLSKISKVPCSPDFVIGAVNIRGRIYSVIDIVRFMGLPAQMEPEEAHILLVKGGGEQSDDMIETCILAHNVPHVVKLPFADVKVSSSTISGHIQKYVHGVTDDMMIILDLHKLLSDNTLIVYEEAR